MFEKAVRQKLRFQSQKGPLSVEDLWDLGLEALDKLYSFLRTEQKASEDDSLLKKATKVGRELELKISIVKHVVMTKQAEADARVQRAAKREKARRVREILAQKKDEALAGMSLEDLEKMAGDLEEEDE
jgi:hypothetical protein